MDKPRSAEEQAFWDKCVFAVLPAFSALAVGKMIGTYTMEDAVGDAYEYATAMLAERRRMTNA